MNFNAYGPTKTFSKENEEKQKLFLELNPGSNPEKPTQVTGEDNRNVNPNRIRIKVIYQSHQESLRRKKRLISLLLLNFKVD
jgi:hypothetical protein